MDNLARSGSQLQRRMGFILSAHGVSHIVRMYTDLRLNIIFFSKAIVLEIIKNP